MKTAHTTAGWSRKAYEAAIRINGDDVDYRFGVVGTNGCGTCGTDDPKIFAASFSQPGDSVATDINVGIAAGPWQQVASQKADFSGVISGKNIIWHGPLEQKGQTVLNVVHNLLNTDTRVIAVAADGKEHTGGGTSATQGGMKSVQAKFSLPLSKIKEFRLQSRPYEEVNFKNVSLRPGVKTEVKIESQSPALSPQLSQEIYPNNYNQSFRTISGTVFDDKGKPAGGGITVTPLPMTNWHVYTDNDGHFVVNWSTQWEPLAVMQLMARDEKRNLAKMVDISPQTKSIDIMLEPGITVTGTVKNVLGQPIPDAKIMPQLVYDGGNSGWGSCFILARDSRSDAKGNFAIAALPRNNHYSLDVKAEGYKYRSRGLTQDFKDIEIYPAQSSANYAVPVIVLEKEEVSPRPGVKTDVEVSIDDGRLTKEEKTKAASGSDPINENSEVSN
jgi:hypothetical protein